jgi:hypothetical protein
MARVSMVTRTVYTTEVQVMCMNIEKVAVETITVTLLGGISDDATILKKVKEKIETETLKPVHIQSAKEIESLYGMTEEDFVKIASILPPRKNNNTGDTTDTTEIEEVGIENEQ